MAGTYDSEVGLARLYTNGVLAASKTTLVGGTPLAGLPIRQSSQPLLFGKLGHFSVFNYARGEMDEVRIWSVARSGADIARDMSCPLSGSESGLVGYWDFESGAVNDVTGKHPAGVMTGNVSVVPIEGIDEVHAGCGRPEFTSIALGTDGFPKFTVRGRVGLDHRIDVSTDLLNWAPLITLANPLGSFEFVDPSVTNFPARFFRVVVP